MTGFKFDSSKAGGFEAIPQGNYEVIIESGAVKQSASGNQYIAFKLKLRDDVEGQAHAGRVLFYNLTFADSTEGIVHGFLKTLETPEGFDFGTDHVEAIKNFAVGRAVVADVGTRIYKGETQNDVKYLKPSQVGGGKISSPFDSQGGEDPFAKGNGPIDISDDDLPF